MNNPGRKKIIKGGALPQIIVVLAAANEERARAAACASFRPLRDDRGFGSPPLSRATIPLGDALCWFASHGEVSEELQELLLCFGGAGTGHR
jgi:hypothetical protein